MAPATLPPADAVSGLDLLRQAGFDERMARFLATKHPVAVIRRQIEWLSLRGAARNRLGLLRRAIELDWPKPEGAPEPAGARLGRLFASHYYAGYHGYAGEAATEPFPKDMELASKFVVRLLAQQDDEKLVPEWGRRFGRLMRDKHVGDTKAKPILSTALVLYGDRFLRVLQNERSTRRRESLGKAREAHEAAFLPEYLRYLRQAENALQQAQPGLYEAFLEARQKLRHLLTSGPFLASAERLLAFDGDTSRLFGFADHFQRHPGHPVLGFWDWDARLNPRRFGGDSARVGAEETHP